MPLRKSARGVSALSPERAIAWDLANIILIRWYSTANAMFKESADLAGTLGHYTRAISRYEQVGLLSSVSLRITAEMPLPFIDRRYFPFFPSYPFLRQGILPEGRHLPSLHGRRCLYASSYRVIHTAGQQLRSDTGMQVPDGIDGFGGAG